VLQRLRGDEGQFFAKLCHPDPLDFLHLAEAGLGAVSRRS
jgi:hypothetical protein